jgi:hypothetical protein
LLLIAVEGYSFILVPEIMEGGHLREAEDPVKLIM